MNESDLFERRFGAIVEALAYSGKSHQDIAETYGLSLDGLEQFTRTWAELIHMARWNRYRDSSSGSCSEKHGTYAGNSHGKRKHGAGSGGERAKGLRTSRAELIS